MRCDPSSMLPAENVLSNKTPYFSVQNGILEHCTVYTEHCLEFFVQYATVVCLLALEIQGQFKHIASWDMAFQTVSFGYNVHL